MAHPLSKRPHSLTLRLVGQHGGEASETQHGRREGAHSFCMCMGGVEWMGLSMSRWGKTHAVRVRERALAP